MAAVLVIGFFVAIGVVMTLASNARTSARTSANEHTRQSIDVISEREPAALARLVGDALQRAGAVRGASFDDTTYFKVSDIEVHLRVTPRPDGAAARVWLPTVRSVSGRPQKLGPVGRTLARTAAEIARQDPSIKIS